MKVGNYPEREVSDRFDGVLRTLVTGSVNNEALDLIKESESSLEEVRTKAIKAYLASGDTDTEYFPHELLSNINISNIGDLNQAAFRSLLRKVKVEDMFGVLQQIIVNITTSNISAIDPTIIDLILNKLKHSPEERKIIETQLCSLVTEDNEEEMDRYVLDLIHFGGSRGEFIRTFAPEHRAWWKNLFARYDRVVKTIGL